MPEDFVELRATPQTVCLGPVRFFHRASRVYSTDIIVLSNPTDSGRGIGTTLRTYSRDRGEWQIVYLGAVSGVTAILHGGREGDDIVLRGVDEDGHNRWTFSDIRADSFTWTGELSPDGATFHVNHRMTGTRRAPEGSSPRGE